MYVRRNVTAVLAVLDRTLGLEDRMLAYSFGVAVLSYMFCRAVAAPSLMLCELVVAMPGLGSVRLPCANGCAEVHLIGEDGIGTDRTLLPREIEVEGEIATAAY